MRILKQSTFLRNASWSVFGSGSSQFILLLATIFPLFKLYSPEQFGVYAVYMSIALIGGTLTTARYEVVIPVPTENRDAAGLFGVSTIFSFTGSMLILGMMFAWIPPWIESLNTFSYLLSLQILVFGICETNRQWLARLGKFGILAIAEIGRTSVLVLVQCLFADSFGETAAGLVIGLAAGWIAFLLITLPFVIGSLPKRCLQIRNIMNAAISHRGNLFLIPSQGLNRISTIMPIFILEAVFGPSVTGGYYVASRFLYGPSALISEPVRSVFFPAASRTYNKLGECRLLFNKVFRWSLLLGAALFIPMSILSPWIISLVSSLMNDDPEKWAIAGQVIQILAPFYIVQLASLPLSGMWIIAGRQRILLVWDCFFLVAITIGLLAGLPTHSLIWSLVGYGMANLVSFTINTYACFRFANGHWVRREQEVV